MRREDQDRVAVSGAGRLGPRQKSTPQRSLPDPWRALYRPNNRGGTAEAGGGDGGQESARRRQVSQLGANARSHKYCVGASWGVGRHVGYPEGLPRAIPPPELVAQATKILMVS
jgi:hypothetical protein